MRQLVQHFFDFRIFIGLIVWLNYFRFMGLDRR